MKVKVQGYKGNQSSQDRIERAAQREDSEVYRGAPSNTQQTTVHACEERTRGERQSHLKDIREQCLVLTQSREQCLSRQSHLKTSSCTGTGWFSGISMSVEGNNN